MSVKNIKSFSGNDEEMQSPLKTRYLPDSTAYQAQCGREGSNFELSSVDKTNAYFAQAWC